MPETKVTIRYEFEDRIARQVVTDNATGREWVIPMRLNGHWREDLELDLLKSESVKQETARTVSASSNQ